MSKIYLIYILGSSKIDLRPTEYIYDMLYLIPV
jgi:hypothetical protein